MPKPASPVLIGRSFMEVVLAKDQPEYLPLPVVRFHNVEGTVLSRWELSAEERAVIAAGGELFIEMFTFGRTALPIRPILMHPSDAVRVYRRLQYSIPNTEAQWAAMDSEQGRIAQQSFMHVVGGVTRTRAQQRDAQEEPRIITPGSALKSE